MHNKFEINQTKSKGGCQSGRKVVPQDSKSDLPLLIPIFELKIIRQLFAYILSYINKYKARGKSLLEL